VHQRSTSRAVDDEAALERVPAPDTPEDHLEHEWNAAVRQALAEVPEHNREIFLLHYIEGFSYDEIEQMTGIRQSALKMRVKRACDFLRSRLSSCGGRQ
jgi:RNA polymerase sigma-70 factor (ECF subfamily)